MTSLSPSVPQTTTQISHKGLDPRNFHVDKYEGKSGIGYGMIIACNLTVQLGLSSNFKNNVLKWYGVTVPMKEPSGLIG